MPKVDLHIHCNLSSDGSGTFAEVAEVLAGKGIATAALTNHIPELSGRIWYGECDSISKLKAQRDCLEDKHGLRILVGAEIDVIDNSGRLAAPTALIEELDHVVSGVHRYPGMMRLDTGQPVTTGRDSTHYGPAEYYAISEGLLRNPLVKVLAHPLYAIDYLYPKEQKKLAFETFPDIFVREIMRIAAEEGKAVELNSSDVSKMDERWFHFGDEYGTTYSLGSDAHGLDRVGEIGPALEAVEKYGIAHDRIMYAGGVD